MKKWIKPSLFTIVVIFQLFILGTMVYRGISKGRIVQVKCVLYDPIHPLKGRYLQLSFHIENFSLAEYPHLFNLSDLSVDREIYVVIEEGTDEIMDITLIQPGGESAFIKGTISSIRDDSIRITYDFNKYFIQEELAPLAEDLFRWRNRENFARMDPYMEMSVNHKGRARIVGLYVYNELIEEYLINQREQEAVISE